MKQDALMVLKNSRSAFVRELVGFDPVAVFRWNTVRAAFQAMNAFRQAGRKLKRSGRIFNSFFFLTKNSSRTRNPCRCKGIVLM